MEAPRRRRGVAAAGVLALALTACAWRGDSAGDADITPDDVPAVCGLGSGFEATGEPIRIGAIATMSGGIDFSSSPKAAKAYFECVNANGGINGRPIAYVFEDDALDPRKASALASRFASDPSVVAMAGGASFIACASNQPIFERANLYDILGVGVPQACFYSRNMSALNAGPRLSLISAVQMQVKGFGIKSFASGGYPIPGLGDWVKDGAEQYADRAGPELTHFDLVPPPVKDATSLVTRLQAENPDAVILGFAASDNASYLRAAEQVGIGDSVRFSSLTSSYDTTFPGRIGPHRNDRFYSNSEFVLLDSTGIENLNWRRVLRQYGSPDQPRDSFSQAGYLAARILVETLENLDPALIDRAIVSTAIQGIKGFRTDMLCRPWYFSGPGGHNNANHQLRNVKLGVGGKYVGAADCFETQDPALADVLAAEKADPSLVGTDAARRRASGAVLPEQSLGPVRIVDDPGFGVEPHRGPVLHRVGRPSRHVSRGGAAVAGEAGPQAAHVPRGRQPARRLVRVEEEAGTPSTPPSKPHSCSRSATPSISPTSPASAPGCRSIRPASSTTAACRRSAARRRGLLRAGRRNGGGAAGRTPQGPPFPRTPARWSDLEQKWADLLTARIGERRTDKLYHGCMALETIDDVGDLVAILVRRDDAWSSGARSSFTPSTARTLHSDGNALYRAVLRRCGENGPAAPPDRFAVRWDVVGNDLCSVWRKS